MEPRLLMLPMTAHGLFRKAEDVGGFGVFQTDEKAQLDDLGLIGMRLPPKTK